MTMALILPILLCFVPLFAVFVVLVFWGKMKVLHLLWALGAGLLCVLPVSVIQFFLGMVPVFSNQNLLFILLKSVLLYGLIEELCKLGIGFVLPKKNYTTLQFLLISFFFGLSLGCFESIIYFLDHLQKSSAIGGVLLYKPVFTRMFTSDLIHTFCSGLLGLFIYNARQKDFHVSLIFLAIGLHGVYDFFAGFANSFKYFSLAVILFAAIECRVKYLIYNRKEK